MSTAGSAIFGTVFAFVLASIVAGGVDQCFRKDENRSLAENKTSASISVQASNVSFRARFGNSPLNKAMAKVWTDEFGEDKWKANLTYKLIPTIFYLVPELVGRNIAQGIIYLATKQ